MFEIATLVQTGKVREFPIVLTGREYWRPLTDFVRNRLLVEGTIDPGDEQRLRRRGYLGEYDRHLAPC